MQDKALVAAQVRACVALHATVGMVECLTSALRVLQSALFEQLGALGGLPHPPSALGSTSSQAITTFKLAAANLKLYLECVALC